MKLPNLGSKKIKVNGEEGKKSEKPKEKKERKIKDEQKHEGSRWSSVILLLTVVFVSALVWVYGAFNDSFGGLTETQESVGKNTKTDPASRMVELEAQDGESVKRNNVIETLPDSGIREADFEQNQGF